MTTLCCSTSLVNDMRLLQLNIPNSSEEHHKIYLHHLQSLWPHDNKKLSRNRRQLLQVLLSIGLDCFINTSAPALSFTLTPSPHPTAHSVSKHQQPATDFLQLQRISSYSALMVTCYEPVQRKALRLLDYNKLVSRPFTRMQYDSRRGLKAPNIIIVPKSNQVDCYQIQPLGQKDLILENKVRQEQALVIQRNKRNAELVQENDLLKVTLSGKEKSIAFLQSEKEKILSEKKDLADNRKRSGDHARYWLSGQRNLQCIDTSSASNAIFEINKLRQQLQGKDDIIRKLDAQISIMKVLNIGSTEGSCDQQALETDRIQLQDTITSLRIQLDGLKIENVSMKRRYDELSKANNHSRIAYTEKLSAFTAENTKLKAQVLSIFHHPNHANWGSKTNPWSKTHFWQLAKLVPKRAPRNHSSLRLELRNATESRSTP
ncbi:hypothetical protein Tco_0674380 [Tanacetum coccineum]